MRVFPEFVAGNGARMPAIARDSGMHAPSF
jgi:hypothetical protein